MKKKNLLFLAAALIMLPLTVYGGGGQQSASGKPEISYTILDRGSVVADEGTYAQNRWVTWINENSPVNVKPVPVLRSESVQQINILFAAGTAPDLVIEYGKSFMDNLYAQGVLQPVDQHIERYSTAYKAYLQKYPELLPYLIAEDGRQYAMSSRRAITDLYIYGWWIRQDWLQKFGMQAPTHINQMIDFCRRVRDENPSGNAEGDFGFVFRVLYFDAIADIFGKPYDNFLVENGHFTDWTSTQGYRDYLSFWAQLYREGLMDREFITDPSSTRQEQYRDVGRAGMYFGVRPSNGGTFFAKTLRQNVPTGVLVPMDPPATDYGRFAHQTQELPEYIVCMNKNAKNPQAIIQYVDWLVDTGWKTLTWGFEGVHYTMRDGVPFPDQTPSIRDQYRYLGDTAFIRRRHEIETPAYLYTESVNPADPLSVEYGTVMRDWFAARLNDRPRQFVPYAPSSDLIARYRTETEGQTTQVKQLEIGIVTGQIPVDQGIQMINTYKNSVGWAAVNAEKDAWYQKNKQLFNF